MSNDINIYFSVDDAIQHINKHIETLPIGLSSGWGHFIKLTHQKIKDIGSQYDLYLVDDVKDADIELFIGQPFNKTYPSMSPNTFYTMTETTGLPKSWVSTFNNWEVILNPSSWGVTCFNKLIDNDVIKLPLIVDIDRFKYVERDINGVWNYLTMGVSYNDRKRTSSVLHIFSDGDMPGDTHLIVKTIPAKGNPEIISPDVGQIQAISANLSFDDLVEHVLNPSHVSVNPSRSEGFGYLTAEHSLTGMLSLCSNYSGFADQIASGYILPIDGKEVDTPFIAYGGKDFYASRESIYKQMLWSYENREVSMQLGRLASDWIRSVFNADIWMMKFRDIALASINKYPKTINKPPSINFDKDWIEMFC